LNTPSVASLLGVDALDLLVAKDFLHDFGLAAPAQYGMVAADVTGAADALETAGAGPFLRASLPAPNWVEAGETRKVRTELAIGYSDTEQIEVLGAGTGTDFYSDRIASDVALTLHHVGMFQLDVADSAERLNLAGYQTAVEGGIGLGIYSTRFAYFDTRAELGFYLEIVAFEFLGRHVPPGPTAIANLARVSGWIRRVLP
jgi:hypothetical protein